MNAGTSGTSREQDYWEFFAEESARTSGTRFYPRLSEGVRNDADLRALAARVKAGQPMANILFGAVHFLVLRGTDHPLKRFYRTVGGDARAEVEDPFPLFKDFVARHRREIEKLVATRVTNTNEVGRSALLNPGFRALASEAGAPLHLVEIGPSAGLNLIWDRYGVRYRRDGDVAAEITPGAPLVLDCELRGKTIPPTGPSPRVASRVGLELNPVDLANADDRDWLRALIWPDDTARLARLDSAISLFEGSKPEIRAGDALALLPEALAAAPRDETVCVYHTIVTYQFSREMREALDAILTVAGVRRPVHRLAFESDGNEYVIALTRYADGVKTARVLGNAHPHGKWLEWRD